MIIDEAIKQWATPRQCEFISAVNEHGSHTKASISLGVSRQAIDEGVRRAKVTAAKAGYSPEHDMNRTVPEGYDVRGVSTLYGKDGDVKIQWVKSQINSERQRELMQEAFSAMSEELPRVPPMEIASGFQKSLCNLYTITDAHVGMLAWGKEGGDDWDLKIAEKTLVDCFEQMVSGSPAAETCIINQLGDFLHYDGLLPVTPAHGHVLDADGRFSKMVGVAIRVLRRMIDFALARHATVTLVLAEGNHDLASSVWLRHMFKALYENEPRIRVIDTELPYYCCQHGRVMLGFHHGHMKGNAALPLLFATQFSKTWGDTDYRYVHTGHRHHVDEKEHSGMTVVQHATLAAKDAYAARGGWASSRQARVMTYHSKHGLVAVNVVTPEMLENDND